MADIFVSYASEDRARIQPLVAELEAAGYSVWWDRQLKGGTRFSAEIEQELKRASVVLVAWSPNATQSRWVADEADLALETGNLLPISLDGARSPMGFRQLQTIDFSGWEGGEAACVSDLLTALQHHLQSGTRTPNQAVELPASANTRSDASIAVLPFVNMSSDPEQDYFSDGISEELLNLLARIKQLTVIARTSSFAFRGSDTSISEIGKLLNVAFVLEGSVRKAANRVRITAQLIETGNSSHLWSQTYDRTLEDIFAVQDEISNAIVEELKGLILGGATMQAPAPTRATGAEAYEHYVLGQQYIAKRTPDDIETAKQHFEKSLAVDADYAPALVGLADTHLLLSDNVRSYGVTPLATAMANALPLLTRALALDPQSAEAHGVMCLYYLLGDDSRLAQSYAEKALALNANYARGYSLLASALHLGGDPTAPIFSTLRQGLERNPMSLQALGGVYVEYLHRLRFDEAHTILQRAVAANIMPPAMVTLHSAQPYRHMGNHAQALAILLDSDAAFSTPTNMYFTLLQAAEVGYVAPFESLDPASALMAHLQHGDEASFNRLGQQLENNAGARDDYDTAMSVADWKSRNGNYSEALEWLAPFDDPDPDGWGPHFQMGYDWFGAILSLHLKRKLGKRAGASLILEKLKYILQAQREDPDGPYLSSDYLEAVIAIAQDDKEAALDALENQIKRTWANASLFVIDQMFEALHGEPRFEALRDKVAAHIAAERKTAEDAGLLPIPTELLERFN